MIRNEEHYVQEWLTFHYVQGFEQFVIVLHKCDDKTEERIKALPFADKIHVHKVMSDTQHAQMGTLVWIAETYGHTTEWLLFCDGDEYSFGTDTDDFREVLARYEDFGGLFVNWLEFGHNNHINRPESLCIEGYTKRAPADLWVHASGKSIIKPRELLRPYAPASHNDKLGYSFLSPHFFKTAKPTVHTDFTPVCYRQWWCSEHICHDVARCHHYRYRSWADWVKKCRQGNANDSNTTNAREKWYMVDDWDKFGDYNIVDLTAVRFAEKIKNVILKNKT